MSFYDHKISKVIWNGKIPVKINIDAKELGTNYPPLFLEVSRCSYLPLVTKDLRKLLAGITEEMLQSAWYDFEDRPLKWHYPIGLLHDLYSGPDSLPWTLTLHFRDLPSNVLLLKPTPENMQDMFMSMVKEADFLRNGSTKKVMNLSKRDSTQLWESLVSDQYNDFRAVNKQLVEYSSNLRHIPMKIYLPDDCPVVQELIPFTEGENVADTLSKIIPELFNETKELIPRVSVITHGVEIPLDTPTHWAYENLSFADNFLHFVILPKK